MTRSSQFDVPGELSNQKLAALAFGWIRSQVSSTVRRMPQHHGYRDVSSLALGVPVNTTSPAMDKRLRFFWWGLLAFNVVLLFSAVPGLLRRDADGYTNEHARSVVGSLSGTLICGAGVSRSIRAKWWLLAAAFLSICISFWLAR
jgi:hypothetical protein